MKICVDKFQAKRRLLSLLSLKYFRWKYALGVTDNSLVT